MSGFISQSCSRAPDTAAEARIDALQKKIEAQSAEIASFKKATPTSLDEVNTVTQSLAGSFSDLSASVSWEVTNLEQTVKGLKSAILQPTRYEVIQSALAAKWTFRLDRFTGKVCQLVETSSKGLAWEEMLVRDLPEMDPTEKQVRFQLFTSTIAARHTYLIDLLTGNTWTPVSVTDDTGKETDIYWRPFAYQ